MNTGNPLGSAGPLEAFFEKVQSRSADIAMVQPLGGGKLREYSWAQMGDEVLRMAHHLRFLGLPPGSHVALMLKNCAEWILADLSIWAAGHVSVPLYPNLTSTTVRQILEHSESRLLFVGKLDTWDEARHGVPDSMPRIAFSRAPDAALMDYTCGTTGAPKGVMHNFGTLTLMGERLPSI